jgi:hypothetical protein
MQGRRISRTARRDGLTAAVLAIGMALALAGPVAAIEWDGEQPITTAAPREPELVATGAQRAIVLWREGNRVVARRTVDAGATWGARQVLTPIVGWHEVAGAAGAVDLIYVGAGPCATAERGETRRLYHRYSVDGGATWSQRRALTPVCSEVSDGAVARSPGGQVTVVWTQLSTGRILARTSTDGGATFGGGRLVGRTGNGYRDAMPCPGPEPCPPVYEGKPRIAIGTGVVYVAYAGESGGVAVRRSLDRGMTWSSPQLLASSSREPDDIIAVGSRAIVGYRRSAPDGWSWFVAYRRTTDRGATWEGGRRLTADADDAFGSDVRFAYRGGLLAATFKYGRGGGDSPIWHRESSDFGESWSPRTRVSRQQEGMSWDNGDVAIIDRQLVAYWDWDASPAGSLWIRRSR